MQITAIYHSSFLVELPHSVLLFDYFQGELPPFPDKQIYVFVSHKHPDHYSRKIWELEKQYSNVSYIIYEDVSDKKQKNILHVACHRRYEFRGLEIETLRSTDEGCAFVILAEGKSIYHAGDLNWWHWEGEPDADNQWQEKTYKQEISRLRARHFDCAFLLLDPRLEKTAWWGFLELLKTCDIDAVFPMHYFDQRARMLQYLELPQLQPYRDKIITDAVKTL